MSERPFEPAEPRAKRRFRFGMRGLIGGVLLLGLVFGWLARAQRAAVEQEAAVAELAQERVGLIGREPTLLCLVLAKLTGAPTILPDTPALFSKWISPGWFSRPVGFNGFRVHQGNAPRVTALLRRLGDVHEVQFQRGLKLFYINKVRYRDLGPERATCTFKVYPAAAAPPGS
jgi:hypothetical protein